MGWQKCLHLCPPIFHAYFWQSRWCDIESCFTYSNWKTNLLQFFLKILAIGRRAWHFHRNNEKFQQFFYICLLYGWVCNNIKHTVPLNSVNIGSIRCSLFSQSPKMLTYFVLSSSRSTLALSFTFPSEPATMYTCIFEYLSVDNFKMLKQKKSLMKQASISKTVLPVPWEPVKKMFFTSSSSIFLLFSWSSLIFLITPSCWGSNCKHL